MLKKKICLILTAVFATIALCAPIGVYAQGVFEDIGGQSSDALTRQKPINTNSQQTGEGSFSQSATTSTSTGSKLDEWLQKGINILSGVTTLVIVISIIIAGIQYMTARDNASQVAAAKNRITMAILAFILFIFAYGILQWLVPGGIFN